MLPESNTEEITERKSGYKTFRLDFDKKTIGDIIDGKEALLQAVRVALMTQRHKYALFSSSYGTDYEGAFDKGYSQAIGKLKNAIYDSLIYDKRINAIDSFSFERHGTRIIVKFRIVSIYGQIDFETEVE